LHLGSFAEHVIKELDRQIDAIDKTARRQPVQVPEAALTSAFGP
jgi:hypothetical protein